MSDFNRYNPFGDDFEEFDNNEDALRKLEEMLSKMFGPKNVERDFSDDDEEDDEIDFDNPHEVEIINKGDWNIKVSTWKRKNGVITEKVEIQGPSKKIPKEIQDFIEERITNKKGYTKNLLDASENVEEVLDRIFKKEGKKHPFTTEEDMSTVNDIAKFWFLHKKPDFDGMINEALEDEDYEKAAFVRDKKNNLEIFNKVTLEKLQEAIDKEDFVAIDAIMGAYKSKLGIFVKF